METLAGSPKPRCGKATPPLKPAEESVPARSQLPGVLAALAAPWLVEALF